MEEARELEGVVEDLYRRAGADTLDVWRPSKLARVILGSDGIVVVPYLRELGHIAKVHGRTVIAVRGRLSRPMTEWVIGHELGHFAGLEDESACDYVGAAIAMRRRPFLRALSAAGDAWDSSTWLGLASRFCVTTTSAVLRIGETEGRQVAVVTPADVYRRGRAPWPDPLTVRRLARTGGPGLRTARLPDDHRRVALEGREAEEWEWAG